MSQSLLVKHNVLCNEKFVLRLGLPTQACIVSLVNRIVGDLYDKREALCCFVDKTYECMSDPAYLIQCDVIHRLPTASPYKPRLKD
ncbi:hypothetical protein J6590_055678 [Homalodisca vitripennis]|nr:hypothetical protein J6590_055678 [Homalodisca vitripennis]